MLIEDRIKEKILNKHNVTADEIRKILLEKPLVLRSGKKRYMAVGCYIRYLAVVFERSGNAANI